MPFQCRTCAGVIYNTRPRNLFSIESATMLLNLIQVTGAVIDNDPTLPSYICACCLHDLKLAIVFRERCLQAQRDLRKRAKRHKREVYEQEEQDGQEEEEQEEEEEECAAEQKEEEFGDQQEEEDCTAEQDDEECEAEQEEANDDILSPPYVVDESPEEDVNFFDEFDACLDAEEEPAKAFKDTNVPEEFETIYETSTDPAEFLSTISDTEEEYCHSESSFAKSSKQRLPDCEQDSSENEDAFAENSLTDSSLPVSPVKPRGRPSKLESMDPSPKATAAKPRKKKPYVTWKNMTEDQIVARKRQQRKRDCVCEQCGRHFTDQSNFKLHMLRHTGIKDFACEECGKRFYTDHLLSLHQRIVHKGEKPYSCRFCTKTFNNSTTRVIHERVHTKARPYSCSHCDKNFSSASGLKRHELIHTGVRAYSCSICEQSFQRMTHLKVHLRSKMHALRAESNNNKEEK